jgi:small subunit ribosomal protein S13
MDPGCGTTRDHREPKGNRHHMARLVGVDLPRDKRIEVALTYIYGIGRTRAQQLLAETGVDPNTRTHALGDDELVKLRDVIEANFKIEGDLRRGL